MNKQFNKELLLDSLLKNEKIRNRVNELHLTKEQQYDALPVMLQMDQEKDDEDTKYLTSIDVAEDGQVLMKVIKSTAFSKIEYLNNILTLDIESINFNDDAKLISSNTRIPILQYLKNYLESPKTLSYGLYLYGNIKTGKTFILKRLAKKLAENNYSIAFLTVSNLFSKLKTLFNRPEAMAKLIDTCKKADHLFLDDIGSEKISNWFRDEILFPILNYRMENNKPNHFSSNYSIVELTQIESKTANSQYYDNDKALRLIERIKITSKEVLQKGNIQFKGDLINYDNLSISN